MNVTPRAASHLARLRDPEDVLQSVTDLFGDRIAVVSSLGPQTLVVMDMLHRLGLRIPTLLLDTGLLFPETYALRLRLQKRYDLDIRAVHPLRTVEEQAGDEGELLWQRDPDRCCQLRKVAPLSTALQGVDAWITGLRRDQAGSRATTETVQWDVRQGRVKVAPLAWWTRADVFAYLAKHDVPYNPLLDEGYRTVGCQPCTQRARPEDDPNDERAGRWSWTGKTECGLHLGEGPR